jgi:hypothetical protein
MPKIGRNDPCPCKSGKKYKRCHGSWEHQEHMEREVKTFMMRAQAEQIQRERQQGLGNPIISAESSGNRFVVVKNRLAYSKNWGTFHDFLFDYIVGALGSAWFNNEITKPLEQTHPILKWYHAACDHMQRFTTKKGVVNSSPMTGAISVYLHLAYDLYSLDHNVELQDKLIGRLRNQNNFDGARYEVFVAASLIRAGFEIEFENEDDRETSHCEFSATYARTGRRFSVEAKRCSGNKIKLGRQLNRALAKHANHPRVVFIDVNVPDDSDSIVGEIPVQLDNAIESLRAFEGRIINGKPLPEAYLFITNHPWHHHLQSKVVRCAVHVDGFQIPDFKFDKPFTLREAIEARERHIEMHELLRSLPIHNNIPSTFDGEIPEFAFKELETPRLLIGQRYLIKDDDGTERCGLLTSASVSESKRIATCCLSFDDGKGGIYNWPLSDNELEAWRRHPDTFFGEAVQHATEARTPLELYDFIHNSYRHTSTERLLELMAESPDIDNLRKLDQPALASIYAERCVNSLYLSRRVESARKE